MSDGHPHPSPILGADPLRPPPAGESDPILDGYGPRVDDAEPAGEAAGIPVGPDEVTAVLVGIFDGLAQLRGPHWHAEPAEFAMAAPPIARELSKPDTTVAAWLATHGDALLIVLGLGAVVVPRAMIEWRVLQLRRQQERDAELATTSPAYEDSYGPRPLYSQPGTRTEAPRPAPPAPEHGADSDLQPPGHGEAAMGIPSDPGAIAASLGGVLG